MLSRKKVPDCFLSFTFRKEFDKPNKSILGYPPEAGMMEVGSAPYCAAFQND